MIVFEFCERIRGFASGLAFSGQVPLENLQMSVNLRCPPFVITNFVKV
jgi:hypothetical protein